MPAGRGNGRSPVTQAAKELETRAQLGTAPGSMEKMLDVSSQLSRKLSWALSSSWESATGTKPPRGTINDLATKYSVELTTALAAHFPLHLTHLSPTVPEQDGEGA